MAAIPMASATTHAYQCHHEPPRQPVRTLVKRRVQHHQTNDGNQEEIEDQQFIAVELSVKSH